MGKNQTPSLWNEEEERVEDSGILNWDKRNKMAP